ncbi:TetR/AcrR family transcriptional regulator [Granulicoccus phenolivorans]|uniref:TetR/AcrR family transcriptional regulator n=1 Tax=Granulicoccus phenolivorans TaxID=266854 RepID=UPI00041B1586|nr:TetR/AcrR family transcriptional regulator [Granulicoccus phenolivorans]
MPKPLVDLLWREHPAAPKGGSRGPRTRQPLSAVVAGAIELADEFGLDAMTIRALAQRLGMSPMSLYTHANSRDDLLVLMADAAYAAMAPAAYRVADWRDRVTQVAQAYRTLLLNHPWLLQIRDPRTALGPGTIARYDHELRAFDGTQLNDVQRDAALTFVLDFVEAGAAAQLVPTTDFGAVWTESAAALGRYVGEDYPLARRVGQAAGAALGAPYSAADAWRFGFERVLSGLAALIDRPGGDDSPRH